MAGGRGGQSDTPSRASNVLLFEDTLPTTGDEWQKDVEANMQWFESEPWFADAQAALAQETTARTDEQMTAVFRREAPLYFADYTHRKAEFDPMIAQMRVFVAPAQGGVDPSAPADVGVTLPFDVRAQLPSIKVPTLVVVGARDFVCSTKMAQIIHDGIAGSQLVKLPKSGHMGHVEEPAAFASAVRTFVGAQTR